MNAMTPRLTVVLEILLLCGIALAVARPSLAEDGADLILRHGVFYPVEPPGRVEGSLAVRGGRIVYLGDDAGAEKLRGPQTRVIDLAGRAVTPGLIDAHSHFRGLGEALQEVDLTGAATLDEVVTRVRDAAGRAPAGAWIRGHGLDQNRWPDKRVPHHETRSAAVPGPPLLVRRGGGPAPPGRSRG